MWVSWIRLFVWAALCVLLIETTVLPGHSLEHRFQSLQVLQSQSNVDLVDDKAPQDCELCLAWLHANHMELVKQTPVLPLDFYSQASLIIRSFDCHRSIELPRARAPPVLTSRIQT